VVVREQGRCAGCQESGELKRIEHHVLQCAKWAALYRADPAAALMPAEEHARWVREERPGEHKADLDRRIADTQGRRAASVARFKVKDPLED
jgi:hypothetical protein